MANPRSVFSIQVDELEGRVRDILERVRRDGDTFDVIVDDVAYARLGPVPVPASASEREAILRRRRKLAEEIGKYWTDDVSAADAVAEGRREL